MRVYTSIDSLIGKTPLLEITHIEKEQQLKAKVLVKLEYFNPAGSVKDRAALEMIDQAEKEGRLMAGGTIIEPTSGNTGIGICAIAAVRGYKAVIVMPETMSEERKMLMKAYGAELVLTEGNKGMAGAIAKAEELLESTPGAIIAGQFENKANALAHYKSTGPEIWEDTEGQVDVFVAGIGTGGTITGTGRYLKEKNPQIQIIGVEPMDSPVLTQGHGGAHGIQGIGAGFVPTILDTEIYDQVVTVQTDDAYAVSRLMASKEGVLVGISSGAALWTALELAKKPEYEGKTIVALMPDTGERYLSTGLYN